MEFSEEDKKKLKNEFKNMEAKPSKPCRWLEYHRTQQYTIAWFTGYLCGVMATKR